MVVSKSRHQAIELTRNVVSTVSLATGKPVDFYRILWVIHWAIENNGLEKTKDTLVDLMLENDFEPDNIAVMLRDKLFVENIEENSLGGWFKRAMTT